MKIDKNQFAELNRSTGIRHAQQFKFLADDLQKQGIDVASLVDQLSDFQVAIPSWALGAGGTRFGRFSFPGEPASLEQKIEDVGVLHALTHSAGAISLHLSLIHI